MSVAQRARRRKERVLARKSQRASKGGSMKREGLTHFQAKRLAQRIANEREKSCLIYRQWSVTGVKHYGVVTERDAGFWQLQASVGCRYPETPPVNELAERA